MQWVEITDQLTLRRLSVQVGLIQSRDLVAGTSPLRGHREWRHVSGQEGQDMRTVLHC